MFAVAAGRIYAVQTVGRNVVCITRLTHSQPGTAKPSTVVADLKLSAAIEGALHGPLDITKLTNVQAHTIPIILSGKDVIGKSHTGTVEAVIIQQQVIIMIMLLLLAMMTV